MTFRQEVRSYATMLPLNLIGRSLERLQIARVIAICLKYMRIDRLLSIQVDCLVFQSPRKRARQVTEELQDLTYAKLHDATRRPLTKYAGPLQDAIKSTALVYQLKQLDTQKYPGGKLELTNGEAPGVEELSWTVRTEGTGEEFGDEVLAHVLSGKSCCVTGPPGCGKSFSCSGACETR